MATLSTTGLYPEDLNGNNPLNLIPNEIQTLQVPGKDDYYFIIPQAAPFFVDSLEVRNHQTGALYKENEDYLVGHWFVEAMDSIGRPIAGSIRFMKRTITGQVRLKYRTIGGNWGFSETQILAELNRKLLNPLVRSWGMIGELPYSFPVLEHDQSVDSLVGSAQILEALDRLADIIEASAAGASDQHLKDFNNPHKVTKAQVGLALVMNYAMATNAEAIAGLLSDRYISPASMLAAITAKAINPMNAHINATGNVHGLTAADINLGNVPNYPAANATQAIDITNNSTLSTPYSVALMVQKLANTARIDELENAINAHINDTTSNPHKVTAEQVGTYTKARIDQLIAQATGGGGDASTFGGKSPAEWAAEFISVTEFDTFIGATQLQGALNDAVQSVQSVSEEPPITPEQEQEIAASLVTGVTAAFDAYAVNNNRWDVRMVADSAIQMRPSQGTPAYPEYIVNGQDKWANVQNARYYVTARGSIVFSGSAAIAPPVGFKDDASFNTANAVDGLWATKTELYAQLKDGGPIRRFKADNTNVQVIPSTKWTPGGTGRVPVTLYTSNQFAYTQSIAIAEIEVTTGASEAAQVVTQDFTVLGDATFVTSMTSALNTVKATDEITDIRITNDHIWMLTATKGLFCALINRANPAALTVALQNTLQLNDGNGRSISIRSAELTNNTTNGEGISQIAGAYGHAAMITNKGNPWFYGDNSQGQCDIQTNQVGLIAIAAGYNYTVTVNAVNQTQFFGDSPDNSMLFSRRGTIIDPTDSTKVWYK
ncbi:virion structural protein [Pseudomonas phage D6]|nr:virion structural protein [Pseudomonas phage D6]